MSSDLRVGVAGATGALGKEILSVLDQAPWRPERVVPLASPSTNIPFVEYGDRQVAVDDLEFQALDELDALIIAIPPKFAVPLAEAAAEVGVLTVDCSGASASEEVPLIVPWINPEAIAEAPPKGVVATPGPAALLLASALGVLGRAGLLGQVTANVMLPASAWGRDGIEELSRQVISLFNSNPPPRKIFPQGLAFDLIPEVGGESDDGWSEAEKRVVSELNRLLPLEVSVLASLVGVPVFSGISASVNVATARNVPMDLVERVLQDGGVKFSTSRSQVPRPRLVEGQPFVFAGRLRANTVTSGFTMWLAMDNLRACAAVAVGCCGAIARTTGDI
ncbi:MAG: hypothetical protein HN348_01680 [Proteobacteria bacterium]|jgi:aspartate-semialdehyde dehydrogenase|nr:hypothetical protein [Pseudomonadota bacterium]